MDNTDVHFFCKFPYINFISDKNIYEGYINTSSNTYDIRIRIDRNNKLKLKLTDKLKPYEKSLEKLADITNVIEFLSQMEMILIKCENNLETSYDTSNDMIVLREYMEFRKFYVNILNAKLSADLKEIHIETLDDAKRLHELIIEINKSTEDGRKLFNVIKCNLPTFIDQSNFKSDNSLLALYDNYKLVINDFDYQEYLDILDAIDKNCWVLEPLDKTLNYRRIALEANTSVTISFNSLNVHNLPQMKFLGPGKKVALYENLIEKNFEFWDPENDILEEILILLGMEEFPKEPLSENPECFLLMNPGECALCFSLQLDDKIPEIVCPNSSCNQFYHAKCLSQWFTSLNPILSGNEIYGDCPNCKKIISCPVNHHI